MSRVDENDQKFHHFSRFERFERFFYINVAFEFVQLSFFRKIFILEQFERVRFFKIISIIQQILNKHIDRLYDNQHDLQHRFEFFENIVKYQIITKNDIIEMRDDFSVFQNMIQNCFSEIMIKMNKNNVEFENFVSFLMIFEKSKKSLTKAKNLHQNRFHFFIFFEKSDQQRKHWNDQNSIFLKMTKKSHQKMTDSHQNHFFSLNDFKFVSVFDRIFENHEIYNREFRDRFIVRNQTWRRNHEFRMFSQIFSFVQFENRVVIVKSNQFKFSNFDFFYFWYFKNQNAIDYVIDDKKIIYINVHMFVEIVRRFIANKNVFEHLHFCLKNAIQIWYIALIFVKRENIMRSIENFCFALITRYENHSANSYVKLQIEQYIVRDVQKRRQFDEYVNFLMRHVVFFNMFELIVLTKIWNSLNKKFRKHVRKSDKKTIVEKFTRNLKNAASYYANDNKKNEKKIVFQREMKSIQKQIQNFERFDRYSESYFENYFINYFFRLQNNQSSRNSQTLSRNFYFFFRNTHHFHNVFRNIYSNIRFLQFKMHFLNVTLNILRV